MARPVAKPEHSSGAGAHGVAARVRPNPSIEQTFSSELLQLPAAASQQALDLYIIPDMFAQYVIDKLTMDQSIAWAEKELREIYTGRRRRV